MRSSLQTHLALLLLHKHALTRFDACIFALQESYAWFMAKVRASMPPDATEARALVCNSSWLNCTRAVCPAGAAVSSSCTGRQRNTLSRRGAGRHLLPAATLCVWSDMQVRPCNGTAI